MAGQGINEQIAAAMDKAFRSLEASRSLCEGRNYDFASSRSYYAAFYALQALMLTIGLSFSKHTGVIGAFSERFIREGHFPREFSRHISRLSRERHMGDYDFAKVISREDAKEDIRIAGEVIEAVKEYLKKNGFIQ